MSEHKVEKDDLVIVVDGDHDPRRWGLVIKEFPSGETLEVQIGEEKSENIIRKRDNLVFVIETNGTFPTPQKALDYYRDQILLDAVLNSITSKELRALKRLKQRIERKRKEGFLGGIGRLIHRVPKPLKTEPRS